MQQLRPKSILLAVGGTGGHLYPAQALARDLQKTLPVDLLFAGYGLSTNRYFQRALFQHVDISSATPRKTLSAFIEIARGVVQSRKVLKQFNPDLVVGFGSFHSFPILLAAYLDRIPFVLFTHDVLPGRVNRFFSKKALFTGIQFPETAAYLKGKSIEIEFPCWCLQKKYTREKARAYYGLDLARPTLLVFGGCQGAEAINLAVSQLALDYQIIHFTGEGADRWRSIYAKRGISAYVAPFEEEMERAYLAADLAIARSGAATLGELMAFELPAILIPWPGAADQHQEKNARMFEQQIGGGKWLAQKELSPESLTVCIQEMNLAQMKQNLVAYKARRNFTNLTHHILNL